MRSSPDRCPVCDTLRSRSTCRRVWSGWWCAVTNAFVSYPQLEDMYQRRGEGA